VEHGDRVGWQRALFGPWPLVPLPLFVIASLAYLNRSVVVAGVSADSQSEFAGLLGVLGLQGVALAALATVPLVALGGWRHALSFRYRADRVPSRLRYLTAIALASLIGGTVQFSYRYVAVDEVTGQGVFASAPLALATNILVSLAFALAIVNAVGYVSYRLGRQTRLLEEQVALLEEQRRVIVSADERVRAEVAGALHDDVQGALLRATLRLTRLAETSADPERAAAVRAVVADLEELRGRGVRAISRRLEPPLGMIGLVGALEELARAYEGTIDVRVDVDPASLAAVEALPLDHRLAVYRIVEQGLLNASAHARAATAAILIRCDEPGRCLVDVVDDGEGLAPVRAPGYGSAVIDAWLGIVGGAWRLEQVPSGGVRLAAFVGGG
jgi:signal transduction histidine kinase